MTEKIYDHYSFNNYKELLKARMTDVRKRKPAVSWRTIADRISIQASYLSKALNDSATHLSEDHLFRIGQFLDMNNDEIDFVLLLRAENTTDERSRKEHLTKKIQDLKKRRIISADFVDAHALHLSHEMNYLLDPMTILIHGALFIRKYKTDPLLLCSQFGISQKRLKSSLELLSNCKYIELGRKAYEIKSVQTHSLHFGREHPLSRINQTAVKSYLISRLNQTSEDSKESFLVTFNMDDKGFQMTKDAFAEFIKKVQNISNSSRQEKLYQLNFDLLEWF